MFIVWWDGFQTRIIRGSNKTHCRNEALPYVRWDWGIPRPIHRNSGALPQMPKMTEAGWITVYVV